MKLVLIIVILLQVLSKHHLKKQESCVPAEYIVSIKTNNHDIEICGDLKVCEDGQLSYFDKNKQKQTEQCREGLIYTKPMEYFYGFYTENAKLQCNEIKIELKEATGYESFLSQIEKVKNLKRLR
jgi:hypothetical protein